MDGDEVRLSGAAAAAAGHSTAQPHLRQEASSPTWDIGGELHIQISTEFLSCLLCRSNDLDFRFTSRWGLSYPSLYIIYDMFECITLRLRSISRDSSCNLMDEDEHILCEWLIFCPSCCKILVQLKLLMYRTWHEIFFCRLNHLA